MNVKIFYAKFDSKRINKEGWNSVYGRAVMKLQNPLKSRGEKTRHGVDGALLVGAYKYIGEIDVKNENDAYSRCQNVCKGHENPFGARSMSIGDVIMFEDYRTIVCKDMGWSELEDYQVKEFKKILTNYCEGCKYFDECEKEPFLINDCKY